MIGTFIDIFSQPSVKNIIESAEKEILNTTGVKIKLHGTLGNVEQMISPKKLKLRVLVESAFKTSWNSIVGQSRVTNIKMARHVYAYLLFMEFREENKSSIGRELNRDHGTIISAINRIKGFYKVGDEIIEKIDTIKKQLQDDGQI